MENLKDLRRRFKEDAINKAVPSVQKKKMPQQSPPASESGFYSTQSVIDEEESDSQVMSPIHRLLRNQR